MLDQADVVTVILIEVALALGKAKIIREILFARYAERDLGTAGGVSSWCGIIPAVFDTGA